MNKQQTIRFIKQQINKINVKIDKLILAGKPYQTEAKEHSYWRNKLISIQ